VCVYVCRSVAETESHASESDSEEESVESDGVSCIPLWNNCNHDNNKN